MSKAFLRPMLRWSNDKQISNGITRYQQLVTQGLELIAQDYGARMERWAKLNRQWLDRTGAARSGLHYRIEKKGDRIRLYFSHGVDYGENLETVSGGKYAIIMPTLQRFAPQIMNKLRSFLRG